MRLLVVNFAMDRRSPVLAWQERLASELARHCERVVVLTERRGQYEQHGNLEVREVPRALLRPPLRWLGGPWAMAGPVRQWSRRERFDVCFVHMSSSWAYRLWPALHPLGIPILLWYAHGTVSWRLRLAHRSATRVVTSSAEGFRIPSGKVELVGQAIDTELFRPPPRAERRDEVVYVGRISPRKEIGGLLDAFAALRRLTPDAALRLRLVGPTLNRADRAYARTLRARAEALGIAPHVDWAGPLSMPETAHLYAHAFVHLNLSRTGSMDKTVLEALACGCPVVTSNEAFRGLLAAHPGLFVADPHPESVARALLAVRRARAAGDAEELRGLVLGRHDLATHATRLLRICASLGGATEGALSPRAVEP